MKIQKKQNIESVLPLKKFFDDNELCIDWKLKYEDGSSVILPIYWNTFWNSQMLFKFNNWDNDEVIDMLYQWVEDNEEILEN
jgi:hypothetical protein